jgi:hypothetical protein
VLESQALSLLRLIFLGKLANLMLKPMKCNLAPQDFSPGRASERFEPSAALQDGVTSVTRS